MKYFKWWILDIILTVFLFAVLFLEGLKNLHFEIGNPLISAVAIVGTVPVIYSAIRSVYNKKISIDLLASIALIFSLVQHEWLSAIFINLMLTSARLLLAYNEARARRNLDHLLKLKPKTIKIKTEDGIVEIKYSDVKVGDIVLVDLGERVPVDGTVLSGTASLDESSLTGESIPVNKKAGNKVASSSLVVSGNLMIKTEKAEGDTTLEKIIKMVEKAQIDKPDIHTVADKFATWYLTAIFSITIILFFFTKNVSLVLAVLLVVCADDIAVAMPLTFLTAISFCARKGIIIKGASFLEALRDVKVVFVDKTGTLTKGKLKVERFVSDSKDQTSALKYAGICSELSDHPMSKAIVAFSANLKEKNEKMPDSFNETSGNGVLAIFDKKELVFGKQSFLEMNKVKISEDILSKAKEEEEKGFNVTFLSYDGVYIGYFVIADEVKENIKDSIEKLKLLGVEKIIMLTGDNERVAKRIKEVAGITGYYANLLPAQKLEHIRESLNKKYKVAMVGDGINDAAALSLADVGIAMGAIGYDVAIESADIVLVKDDFSRVPEMIEISKYVMKIAEQDFWIWGFSNLAGLGLVFTGILAPTGASAFNFLTDFLPLINSTRVFQVYLKNRI
ncbi:MAG: cation-translocating P-type ATPase [Candidatus Pacebacteria bacterium]|nr:cation-translocating P-type ATPase [Candidatus Paceibacterota bacterium]